MSQSLLLLCVALCLSLSFAADAQPQIAVENGAVVLQAQDGITFRLRSGNDSDSDVELDPFALSSRVDDLSEAMQTADDLQGVADAAAGATASLSSAVDAAIAEAAGDLSTAVEDSVEAAVGDLSSGLGERIDAVEQSLQSAAASNTVAQVSDALGGLLATHEATASSLADRAIEPLENAVDVLAGRIDAVEAFGARLTTAEGRLTSAAARSVVDALSTSLDEAKTTLSGVSDGVAAVKALGTSENPARTCNDIYNAGASTGDGDYVLKSADGQTYTAYCLMTEYGGGWTRFLNLDANVQATQLKTVPCARELVQIGNNWVFSASAMASSHRKVLVRESQAPFRTHMLDFDRSTNCRNYFMEAVTGDYRYCDPFIYRWGTKEWFQQVGGTCNNNQHSQFNCVPTTGIRFHYPTRNCANDGGDNPATAPFAWFTGYDGSYAGQYAIYVKNWNGAANVTPHMFFYR